MQNDSRGRHAIEHLSLRSNALERARKPILEEHRIVRDKLAVLELGSMV
jgi:hypothetical protein